MNRLRCLLSLVLLAAMLLPSPPAPPGAYAAPNVPAPPDTPADLLQFTSGGHVLGFGTDKLIVSNGTYAMRVEFVDAQAVQPQAVDSVAGAAGAAPPLHRVTYPNLWPGITLVYDAEDGLARSTYTLEPGADPAAIRLRYNAAVTVEVNGSLRIAYDTGALHESPPIAWQIIDGARVPVDVAFQTSEVSETSEVFFRLGCYDSRYPLIIDPTLTWNTFLGGSGRDEGYAIAVDGSGNVYVAGSSTAAWGSPVRAHSGNSDAFAAKLSSAGALTWHTFLGGGDIDRGEGIAVDGSGNVYVAGDSYASWGENPVRAYSGKYDAFTAKLSSAGALIWHTFLGGSDWDFSNAIAVDGSSNVYVAGSSTAAWGSPVRAHSGDSDASDAFVAKLSSAGVLTWHTFLGQSGEDFAVAIAVDGSGNVYVTGTSSFTWGSPVRAHGGHYDAFAAKLSSAGDLTWHTFLGGSDSDAGNAIAVDGSGNVYVAGDSSTTWGSPVRAHSGFGDAFAAKLSSAGTLTWHTFLGGSGSDRGYAIAVDGSGNVYVAGYSTADWGSPVRAYSGGRDAFATQLSSAGALTRHTFLGGSGADYGYAIAVDGSGNVYVAGDSNATWGSPVRAYGGGSDAFVAKLSVEAPVAPSLNTIANADGDGNYTVSWNSVSTATGYTLQEAANSSFTGAVTAYSGSSTSTNISGKSPGTYYYRVRASNASGDSAWSNTQSVVVVAPPAAPTLNAIANADGDGNYTVSWNSVSNATGYTLQEAANSSFTGAVTAYSGSSTSTSISGKAPGTYYYRVRASNAGGDSAWSNTQSVVVLAPPAVPTLNTIANADGDGNYTVSWGSVSNATGYTLQEAANSSFTGATTAYSGSNTSTSISGKSPGTYYYRVKASNAGGDSAWSNTQSVTVTDSAAGDAYEPDDTCAQARAILTDGTVQQRTFHKQADEDWVVFEATAGVTYRVEGQVPVGSPADVNLEIYAQCAGAPLDEQHNTFAPGVRLEFTAPADGPLYLRWLNYDPAVYGDAAACHISVQALAAEATPGVVIIVAGRDKYNDTLQPNIHYAAGQFYQMFQNNGYPANRIYYLSTDLTQPGANALATAGNLETALTTWALDKAAADRPLTLYLIDHGMPNRLYLDKPAGEWVTPTQLDTWLAQVEAAHPSLKVNVFVEACYAGSFIGLPQSLSRAGRVVATSTGATNLAYASAKGAVFSDYFGAALNQGMSVYGAFESARGATRAAYPYQTPWLDANGNGIPNEPEDAQIAAARGFAYAGMFLIL